MPFHLPPKVKYLLVLSFGIILKEIIPANENIMDSSQDTPFNKIKVVEALETDHKGYPDAFPMIAFMISYNQ